MESSQMLQDRWKAALTLHSSKPCSGTLASRRHAAAAKMEGVSARPHRQLCCQATSAPPRWLLRLRRATCKLQRSSPKRSFETGALKGLGHQRMNAGNKLAGPNGNFG